jgi:hypothetical protein
MFGRKLRATPTVGAWPVVFVIAPLPNNCRQPILFKQGKAIFVIVEFLKTARLPQ